MPLSTSAVVLPIDKKNKTFQLSFTAMESVALVVEVNDNLTFTPSRFYIVTAETTEISWMMGAKGATYIRAIDRAGNLSDATAVRTTYFIYMPVVMRN